MFKKVDPKRAMAEIEHEILDYWNKNQIFQKSVERNFGKKKFVFFDGPPFANGLPHYGHILANALKDAVTRYWNMKGYFTPRTNGWDCHGLPVEYEIEKELNIAGKKEIEALGVATFNRKCRESVFRYTKEWEKMLERIGRWVDFNQTYATLENSYIESIWWIFSQIWQKKMVYQGYKSMHICPRCATPLSNFEVTLGYKEVTDYAVIAKFKLKDEKNSYVLAWTTTPWTLPGNSALAFKKDANYLKIKFNEDFYILAEDRLEALMKDKQYKIEAKFKGLELVDKKYEPLFDYFLNSDIPNINNSYKIVAEDFVTMEEGTGIVHIAPSFGEDDLQTGLKNKLAIITHVDMNGCFIPKVKDFATKFVKGQDQNIGAFLEKKGLLFSHENFRHAYPHCWRCDTPLLNYVTNSWFIKVCDLKKKLLKNNQKIHWQPDHIKEGRFGKWLENVRDWAISRNRYWGAPIPLWKCFSCGHFECISAIDELSHSAKDHIKIIALRHVEYEGNVNGTLHSDPNQEILLTERGVKHALALGEELKNEKIELIISSQLFRAKETARIIGDKLGLSILTNPLLNETKFGSFDGKAIEDYMKCFSSLEEYIVKKPALNADSFFEVVERLKKLMREIRTDYKGKTIVLVTHGSPLLALEVALGRRTLKQAAYLSFSNKLIPNGGIKRYIIGNEPINEEGDLDLHKPYIDQISFPCPKCFREMKRIEEVFDCWFESGAMPYAQLHYPFENKAEFENNFPANFIAEGLDQTRGWFYTLHVLSTLLFDKPAFKNVIVNGILLAADGEKLSKRKKNYPDPNKLFESMGVDSVRYFLYSSVAPLAEDVRFSEKHVEEVLKKVTLTLFNTYSFFVTYALIDNWFPTNKGTFKSKNKLDRWILSELNTLIFEVTKAMDEYNLTLAMRPISIFIDNLSNWYVRRSRRRFWKSESDRDKLYAYTTLYEVLVTLAKILAPFMPYLADEIYQNLTQKESVHLADWPKARKQFLNAPLNQKMSILRKIVELGHRSRGFKKIKVRQPLREVIIALPKNVSIPDDLEVIKEELNVKEVNFVSEASNFSKMKVTLNFRLLGSKYGEKMQFLSDCVRKGQIELLVDGKVRVGTSSEFEILDPAKNEVFIGYEAVNHNSLYDVVSEGGLLVALDCQISPELKKEGMARDLVRYVQEIRKKANYEISDRIYLYVHGSQMREVMNDFADFIMKETLALEIQEKGDFEWDLEQSQQIEGNEVTIAVRRARFNS